MLWNLMQMTTGGALTHQYVFRWGHEGAAVLSPGFVIIR